jgi:methylglutaconyl-CoA hydratase
MIYNTIKTEKSGIAAGIILNRPEKHNALNAEMISELTHAFKAYGKDDSIRAIVLSGEGKSFCAGADLNYMKEASTMSFNDSVEDSRKLGQLFETIYSCPKVVIALVHGAAYGGANGLYAAADFAFAAQNTRFAFSEVKLGIAPAVIAPYILRRCGEFHARDLMLTARLFSAEEAAQMKLINLSLPAGELENEAMKIIKRLEAVAPNAMSETKNLILRLTTQNQNEIQEQTAQLIARLRQSEEGQEGMSAFLEKRKAQWNIQKEDNEAIQ